jgi:hypothetical protein
MIENEKIRLEYLINSSSENEYVFQIDRKSFYEDVRKYDFDLIKFFKLKVVTDSDRERFNILLRKLKENNRINIFESIIFIEQDFSDIKGLAELLDEEIKQVLKEELSKSYHIKLPKNKLLNFLSAGKE